MKCFRCDVALEDDHENPVGGTRFVAKGNWGSGVFDPIDEGSTLEIYFCDECLRAKKSDVVEVTRNVSVTFHKKPWTD